MADQPKPDITPQRMIIRHLSGSKANQIEEFTLSQVQEVKIGRTALSEVKYDPDRDDLVSREHAKIEQDSNNPNQFIITDLDSRNGTFVNKQRIIGLARIVPGDVIQFGPAGPEFEFDLDPRPDSLMRPTRLAEGAVVVPPATRESAVPAATAASDRSPSEPPASAKVAVGKETVERMVVQSQGKSNRTMLFSIAGVVVLLALISGFLYMNNQSSREEVEAGLEQQRQQLGDVAQRTSGMTPREIAAANADKVVMIEVAWKLIHTETGGQIYHNYVQVENENGALELMPAYIQADDGTIEPVLTLDSGNGINKPIGSAGGGASGFIVGSDGFILTNRHVAAAWNSTYEFPPDAVPGAVVDVANDGGLVVTGVIEQPIRNWVPVAARQLGGKPVSGKFAEGRNDYLDVIFPKTERRIPARLANTSNRHDVALLKIDIPQSLAKVELHDAEGEIQAGEDVTVMGYPGVAPQPIVGEVAQDVGTRVSQSGALSAVVVPDPTVTPGNVGRVVKGRQAPSGRTEELYLSVMGDYYQLTVTATGHGNSGGPVFDNQGRVVGIFSNSIVDFSDATKVTFAVPIRYGTELMGIQSTL